MTKFINFILIYLFFIISVHGNEVGIINEINVEGAKRISYETILSYGKINSKTNYSEKLSNNVIKNLYDTELFSDVSIRYSNNIITITVKENPTVNLVLFEGNNKKKDEDLIEEIKLKERSVFSRSRVKEDVKRLLELYQRSGRLSATIDPSVELLDNNRINLIYKINEAKVSKVAKISIIGNKAFNDKEIKKIMTTKAPSLLKFWSSGGQYDPDRIEYDKELIKDFYSENGFVNFKFTSSIAQLINDSNNFEIILSVSEGDEFKFGTIKVKTVLKKLNSDIIEGNLVSNTGNIFNSKIIKDSIEFIKSSSAGFGFTFIKIDPIMTINEDKKIVDIVFEINEGPKVYINRININGNTRTIDNVIRREFNFSEGDAYNKFSINYSKDSIKALNYFETVDISEVRVENTDRLNLDVAVVEKNTGSATIGAGYGDQNGATLTAGLSENNFLGKGQKVKFSTSFSNTQNLYDISALNDKSLLLKNGSVIDKSYKFCVSEKLVENFTFWPLPRKLFSLKPAVKVVPFWSPYPAPIVALPVFFSTTTTSKFNLSVFSTLTSLISTVSK